MFGFYSSFYKSINFKRPTITQIHNNDLLNLIKVKKYWPFTQKISTLSIFLSYNFANCLASKKLTWFPPPPTQIVLRGLHLKSVLLILDWFEAAKLYYYNNNQVRHARVRDAEFHFKHQLNFFSFSQFQCRLCASSYRVAHSQLIATMRWGDWRGYLKRPRVTKNVAIKYVNLRWNIFAGRGKR